MIMIELEALNWSFQLLLYIIYDMISGMSRADVKNVLLISKRSIGGTLVDLPIFLDN